MKEQRQQGAEVRCFARVTVETDVDLTGKKRVERPRYRTVLLVPEVAGIAAHLAAH